MQMPVLTHADSTCIPSVPLVPMAPAHQSASRRSFQRKLQRLARSLRRLDRGIGRSALWEESSQKINDIQRRGDTAMYDMSIRVCSFSFSTDSRSFRHSPSLHTGELCESHASSAKRGPRARPLRMPGGRTMTPVAHHEFVCLCPEALW